MHTHLPTLSPITRRVIALALEEDLNGQDVTTAATISGDNIAKAKLIAKQALVLCGCAHFSYILEQVTQLTLGTRPSFNIQYQYQDGDDVPLGAEIATITGPSFELLRAERTALNIMQHLSGIATQTRQLQQLLGDRIRLVNTRKTLPGMRDMQHYAVQVGGGTSHRFNLSSGVMIKDNHIAAAGSIAAAVAAAKKYAAHTLRIEVEVTTLDECQQALDAGADIIMLDNMTTEELKQAIALIDHRAIVEVSGNVTLENAARLRALDIDVVSSGALTHSAKGADISLKILEI